LQGELEVVKEVHRKHIMEMKEDGNEQNGEADLEIGTAGIVTETSKVPFLMLGLDLPPPPLFKDAIGEKYHSTGTCFTRIPFIALQSHGRSLAFTCLDANL
jgi:hypothetical protein